MDDAYDNIKKGKKGAGRFIGLFFTLIGLVFVGVGGALTYSTYEFMNNAQLTTGQVISVDATNDDGSTTYQPYFSYFDTDGNRQEGTTFLSSSSYDFAVGSKMEILYNTRDYSAIRMNNGFDTWGFGVLVMAAGIIPLLIGLFIRKLSNPKIVRRIQPERDAIRDKYVRLDSPESQEDHRRETEYKPSVRR